MIKSNRSFELVVSIFIPIDKGTMNQFIWQPTTIRKENNAAREENCPSAPFLFISFVRGPGANVLVCFWIFLGFIFIIYVILFISSCFWQLDKLPVWVVKIISFVLFLKFLKSKCWVSRQSGEMVWKINALCMWFSINMLLSFCWGFSLWLFNNVALQPLGSENVQSSVEAHMREKGHHPRTILLLELRWPVGQMKGPWVTPFVLRKSLKINNSMAYGWRASRTLPRGIALLTGNQILLNFSNTWLSR